MKIWKPLLPFIIAAGIAWPLSTSTSAVEDYVVEKPSYVLEETVLPSEDELKKVNIEFPADSSYDSLFNQGIAYFDSALAEDRNAAGDAYICIDHLENSSESFRKAFWDYGQNKKDFDKASLSAVFHYNMAYGFFDYVSDLYGRNIDLLLEKAADNNTNPDEFWPVAVSQYQGFNNIYNGTRETKGIESGLDELRDDISQPDGLYDYLTNYGFNGWENLMRFDLDDVNTLIDDYQRTDSLFDSLAQYDSFNDYMNSLTPGLHHYDGCDDCNGCGK